MVIAILLHYFYMCTFAWMFVEGLHIYRMLTELRNINHGHMRFYYAMGWGIPAIITGETHTFVVCICVNGPFSLSLDMNVTLHFHHLVSIFSKLEFIAYLTSQPFDA